MAENKLQATLITTVREKGGYVVNIHGSPLTPKGTHDLLICINGRFLSCEVKTDNENGIISEQQLIQGRKVLKAGGGVIYCENYNHFIRVLDYYKSLPEEPFPTELIFRGDYD